MCAGYTQSAGEGHPECVRHNPFCTLYLYKKDRQGRPDTGERKGGEMPTRGRECDQILVVKLPVTPRAVTVTSSGVLLESHVEPSRRSPALALSLSVI